MTHFNPHSTPVIPGIRKVGLQDDSPVKIGYGLFVPAECCQRIASVVPNCRIIGPQFDRPIKIGYGLFLAVEYKP